MTGVKLDDAVKVDEEEVVQPKKAKKVEVVEPEPEEGQVEGNPVLEGT